MRNLVQPLPSTHCEHCNGELLFKCTETDDPALDIEVQIFVCAKCGREHSRRLIHEPYTAHTATGRGAEGSL
jgi:DNA-directed RNA polymerase subunit RPC12/RpoP